MNILSIPSLVGGHSHLIPLFVFHQCYLRRLSNVNNFFLAGGQNKRLLKANRINRVDLDYSIQPYDNLEILRWNILVSYFNNISPHVSTQRGREIACRMMHFMFHSL